MASGSDVLAKAKSQLGTRGGSKYWAAMGYGSGYYGCAWCAVFANWCLTQCGMGLPRQTMNCGTALPYGIQGQLAAAGATQVDKRSARAGDIAIYTFRAGIYSHTGIVESVGASTVTSIDGNVSNSVGRRTYALSKVAAVWRPRYSGAGATKASATTKATTATKTVDELAREVIAGKWGTGSARKGRLTRAGHDYDAVQARVNELMGGKAGTSAAKASTNATKANTNATKANTNATKANADGSIPAGTYALAVALNARTAPSTRAGRVAYVWPRGSKVTLEGWITTADGWVWGRYVGGGTGGYRYVAVRSADGKTVHARRE